MSLAMRYLWPMHLAKPSKIILLWVLSLSLTHFALLKFIWVRFIHAYIQLFVQERFIASPSCVWPHDPFSSLVQSLLLPPFSPISHLPYFKPFPPAISCTWKYLEASSTSTSSGFVAHFIHSCHLRRPFLIILYKIRCLYTATFCHFLLGLFLNSLFYYLKLCYILYLFVVHCIINSMRTHFVVSKLYSQHVQQFLEHNRAHLSSGYCGKKA